MPVTIRPAAHASREWGGSDPASSAEDLFQRACPGESSRCEQIIQFSFNEFLTEAPIWPSTNGFVHSAVKAYSFHHHLTIRPEDVWFAILVQIGFFINSHAEELRTFFVSHLGQKELEVIGIGTIDSVDFGDLALQMTDMIAKNVNDPELRTWIMPAFSTTTQSDIVVAAILMMGTMQQYFTYKFTMMCGIPSVTLLGNRADWEEILKRLEFLPRLGPEPAQFYALLKPVLRYFVMSFDSPTDPIVIDFWSKIAHEFGGGSGPSYLSGWITAFCFWKPDGKSLYSPDKGNIEPEDFDGHSRGCNLDGTLYHRVETDDIPDGHAAVPVTVDDHGVIHKTRMVAGSIGIAVTSSGNILDEGYDHNYSYILPYGSNGQMVSHVIVPQLGLRPGLDSLQPVSGWWMYEESKAVDGAGGKEERLKTYLEDDEDLEFNSEAAKEAAAHYVLREQVGV